MIIKKIGAIRVKDSRKNNTIQVYVITNKGDFITSAPAGKSTGKYEVKSYKITLEDDIKLINHIKSKEIEKLLNSFYFGKKIFPKQAFDFLKKFEKTYESEIGGNTLYALEASLLKAISASQDEELWQFLNPFPTKFPRPLGNTIGGGLHSKGRKNHKPDFQEFLFIPDCASFQECVRANKLAYELSGRLLNYFLKKRNDEGAYETELSNERVLNLMDYVRNILKKKHNIIMDIGIDFASSGFYKGGLYHYKNPPKILDKKGQIDYVAYLAKSFNLLYLEDPLDELDFDGFSRLNKKIKPNSMVVGDDLTTTNPDRLKKAIKEKSISGIIVKPNQIGSLVKVKEVIELAKTHDIKTIISHRSGETLDFTIADLAIGFESDFIKTGIFSPVREAKLNRIIQIFNKEKSIKEKEFVIE